MQAGVRDSGVVSMEPGGDLLMEWVWVMKNEEASGDEKSSRAKQPRGQNS